MHTFAVENEVAYAHYKLDITANGGLDGTKRNIVAISEWQFVTENDNAEEEEDDSTSTDTKLTVDTETVLGTAENDGGEGNLSLFDGNVNSKLCIPNATALWFPQSWNLLRQ